MFSLSYLTQAEQKSFEQALTDGRRHIRITARLYNNKGQPTPKELMVIDGSVEVDASDPKETVSRTAHLTIADPFQKFPVDATNPSTTGTWFAHQIGLEWGIWVTPLGRWIDVPVFKGWVFEVARRGIEVDIDAQGLEAGHLPPATFPRALSIRKATKVSEAIKRILQERGETRFSLERTSRGLRKDFNRGLGQSPWKAVQNLAETVDKQLYVQGDGTFRLRDLPTQPSLRLTEGKDDTILTEDAEERISRSHVYNLVIVRGESKPFKQEVNKKTTLAAKANVGATSIIVVDGTHAADNRKIIIGGQAGNPETRKVDPSYTSGTTIPLSSPLDRKHPKGAPILFRFRKERTKRIYGRAKLTQHPLSAENLSDGKRPLIWIEDRPRIHKKKHLEEKAANILARKKRGLDDDITIHCLTDPRLEEGDRIVVEVGDKNRTLRIKSFSIPLNLTGAMTINWLGHLSPGRGRQGAFGNLERISEIGGPDSVYNAPSSSGSSGPKPSAPTMPGTGVTAPQLQGPMLQMPDQKPTLPFHPGKGKGKGKGKR